MVEPFAKASIHLAGALAPAQPVRLVIGAMQKVLDEF
ncbi:MAG: hypothetical protein RL341_2057, partial [Pseudomonadota bacterium]